MTIQVVLKACNAKQSIFFEIPNNKFITLNNYNFINSLGSLPTYLLYKYDSPFKEKEIQVQETIAMPFGNMYRISSSNYWFAYIFELPTCYLQVFKDSWHAIRMSSMRKKKFENLQAFFQDKHLTGFHSEEHAMMVVSGKNNLFLKG